MLNGSQLATVSSPLTLSGWQDVDIAIRLVLHQPVPAGDGVVPWVLLTKSNIGTPSDSYDRPTDDPLLFLPRFLNGQANALFRLLAGVPFWPTAGGRVTDDDRLGRRLDGAAAQ